MRTVGRERTFLLRKSNFIYYILCTALTLSVVASIIDWARSEVVPTAPVPVKVLNPPLKVSFTADELRQYQFVMRLRRDYEYVLATLPITGYYVIVIAGTDITYLQIPNCTVNITIGEFTWTFSRQIALRFQDAFVLAGTNITVRADVPPGFISHFGTSIEIKSHLHTMIFCSAKK